MYIHKEATIDNVFLDDFMELVRDSINNEESASYEILCNEQTQIYNTCNCTVKKYMEFSKKIYHECACGSCLVVKTCIKDGVFTDTVYIVNFEY